jgi:hypothetical protein
MRIRSKENHGKIMGKSWENMEKYWLVGDNSRIFMG